MMTRVLPEPAAARTRSGPSTWVTASRWAGVRSLSRSIEALHRGVGPDSRSVDWSIADEAGPRECRIALVGPEGRSALDWNFPTSPARPGAWPRRVSPAHDG